MLAKYKNKVDTALSNTIVRSEVGVSVTKKNREAKTKVINIRINNQIELFL